MYYVSSNRLLHKQTSYRTKLSNKTDRSPLTSSKVLEDGRFGLNREGNSGIQSETDLRESEIVSLALSRARGALSGATSRRDRTADERAPPHIET